ncbi:unnamed protein product [Chrysodeixis includens]|uniref:N-acetyltransferase domain-containing protein n=1 Tax=Chrysodeixis includens TaxID=689277 RepID=A0A9P0BLF5_CHRIL|nr:unnamed protein product [Chrysodeixis includens]
MWHTTADGKYRVESLSAATFPGATKVLTDHFFLDENVCIGTEVDKNPEAGEEQLELIADAALDGLSLVAVEVETGEVVSVLFNKLQVAPSDSSEKSFFEVFAEERCKHPASRAVVDFMIDLDARCNYFEKYGVDCGIELMYMGTHREHRQKGLAKLLGQTTLELAKKYRGGPYKKMTVEDLGPKYSFIKPRKPITKDPKICTGLWSAIGSSRVGKALGFEVLLKVDLKDFFYNGKSYTDRIGADAFCEGAARRID